jgi:hypothetical protein
MWAERLLGVIALVSIVGLVRLTVLARRWDRKTGEALAAARADLRAWTRAVRRVTAKRRAVA